MFICRHNYLDAFILVKQVSGEYIFHILYSPICSYGIPRWAFHGAMEAHSVMDRIHDWPGLHFQPWHEMVIYIYAIHTIKLFHNFRCISILHASRSKWIMTILWPCLNAFVMPPVSTKFHFGIICMNVVVYSIQLSFWFPSFARNLN